MYNEWTTSQRTSFGQLEETNSDVANPLAGEGRVRAALVRGHLGGKDGDPAAGRRTGHPTRLLAPQGTHAQFWQFFGVRFKSLSKF